MYRARTGGLMALAFSLLVPAALALDVIVTRHAETLANVTKDSSTFNQRHFTEAGLRQIADLTRALRGQRFDAILVSPAYRVLRTIQPHLEEAGEAAEIWPDLDECCRQQDRASDRTPPGLPILLEPEQRSLFLLREDAPTVAPGAESYAEGLLRARRVADDIRARWAGTESRILVVTHDHTGARLVEALLGSAPDERTTLHYTQFTHLKEEGGRFVLLGQNLDAPALAVP